MVRSTRGRIVSQGGRVESQGERVGSRGGRVGSADGRVGSRGERVGSEGGRVGGDAGACWERTLCGVGSRGLPSPTSGTSRTFYSIWFSGASRLCRGKSASLREDTLWANVVLPGPGAGCGGKKPAILTFWIWEGEHCLRRGRVAGKQKNLRGGRPR
jgi:hypothetical protein